MTEKLNIILERVENIVGKGKITSHQHFLIFPQYFQKVLKIVSLKQQMLDFSKLKEFAYDNFELYENGRKLSIRVESTVGKGEIARYEQFLLFPQCFQKTCTETRKNQGLFGKGLKSGLYGKGLTKSLKSLAMRTEKFHSVCGKNCTRDKI